MSKIFSFYQSRRQTIYGHLALARVSNSPTVVSNTLAGAALAGAQEVDGKLAVVALAMILFYSAGMYLNDLLDYSVDCCERPTRPLPAGIVSQRAALVGVIALFGCGGTLLLIVGLYAFLSGWVLIGLIICYDRWHKGNPFSPVLMALCRGMVYVTAFLAFSVQSLFNLLFPCCLLVLYVIGLTSLAKIESGSFIHRGRRKALSGVGILGARLSPSPDERDGRALPKGHLRCKTGVVGEQTPVPTRNLPPKGRRKAPTTYLFKGRWVLSNIGIIVMLIVPAVYFAAQPLLLSLLFDLIFAAWVLYNIISVYASPKPQVGRTVGQLIAGIALLDSLVLLACGNYHGLLLALVAFGLTLFLQRYVKGT